MKGGAIWDFSKSILSKNIKKLKVKKNFKKSLTEPKILFGPVEFLNDIKILLRELRIVRN